MRILAVCGSSAASKRTKALLRHGLAGAAGCGVEIQTDWVDLAETPLEFCDGRPVAAYNAQTQQVLQKVQAADAYLLGTPMYRGSMTGALKNLLDLIPVEFMRGKAAGLVATGGSDHHYLGLELGLRTALSFFQVHTIPGILYASRFTVEDGAIVEEPVRTAAERFGQDLVELARSVSGKALGPALF
ncbi:MAG: NAD(P)H-dependent oxidoreductase [Alicyclobacillus sp.]|nr:NAD(P)H-dependent oxidoreductase [Alicyclobacillus sp.]